jgi:hypothetical protein
MNTLSARENYHRTHTEKERSDLSGTLNSTPVKEAMIVAMAYIAERGSTREQLIGARNFASALLNLPDTMTKEVEMRIITLDPVPTPDGR